MLFKHTINPNHTHTSPIHKKLLYKCPCHRVEQISSLGWPEMVSSDLRDWSLITGRGGLQNGRGGAREVLPLQKGGAEKVLAKLKGGHKKFWGSFYAVA